MWLESLPEEDRTAIGMDVMAAQFGWPLGLPLVDHIDGDVREVRTKLATRIARVLFVVDGTVMVLRHGFVKQGNRTPLPDLHTTKTEMARRMETSRTQLDRLLDPAYPSVTLATIAKAATALGKKMSISFEDFLPVKSDVVAR